MEMVDWAELAKDRFTKLFARIHYGSVESVERYGKESSEDRVYWVDSNSRAFGQTTLVNTIILNKHRLDGLSTETKEYVYRHEQGHIHRHPILTFLLKLSIVVFLAGFIPIFMILEYSLLTGSIPTTEPALRLGVISLLMILSLPVAIHLDELFAELYALEKVGKQTYLNAHAEMPSERKSTLTNQALIAILYPNPETVVFVNRLLKRLERQ